MKRVLLLLALAACRPSSNPSQPAPPLDFGDQLAWPERTDFPGVGEGRLIVTNSRDDSLSILDATKIGEAVLPEVFRAPIGLNPVEIDAPHHAAMHPSGEYFFVPLSQFAPGSGSGPHGAHGLGDADGTLVKISAHTGLRLSAARVDRNPGDVALSPDGKTVAVSHYDLLKLGTAQPDSRVVLLDAETMQRKGAVSVCPAPHGVRFSGDGKKLFVACYSDELAVVNLEGASPTVTRHPVAPRVAGQPNDLHQPYGVAIDPLTLDLFLSCPQSGDVRVLKANTYEIDAARSRHLPLGKPFLAEFSADGKTLWVPAQQSETVYELDPATGAIRRTLALPSGACVNAHAVLPAPDPRWLLVVCEGDHAKKPGALLVLDVGSGAVRSITPLGLYPDYVGLLRKP